MDMATSKKCRRCEVTKSVDCFDGCKACNECRAKERQYVKDNAVRFTKKWKQDYARAYAKNKELKNATRRNDLSAKRRRRASKYGLSSEELMNLESVKHCQICSVCIQWWTAGSATKHSDAVIDHCHETGTVRGVLCSRCNMGIGLLCDSPDIASRAAKYLS